MSTYVSRDVKLTSLTHHQFDRQLREFQSRSSLYVNPSSQTAAQDVIALSKGMINAAGIAGESDLNYLQQRVEKTVFGYLDLT